MAPKAAPKPVEDEGPKVYITVAITSISLFSAPTAGDATAATPPAITVSALFPGEKEDWRSEPCSSAAEDATHNANFARTVIRRPGVPLLNQLLSSPLTITVFGVDPGQPLATASLDFLPLSGGTHLVEAPQLHLEVAPPPQDAENGSSGLQFREKPSISVQVRLEKAPEGAAPETPVLTPKTPAGKKGAEAAAPPPVQPPPDAVPCMLITLEQAQGSMVVQLGVQGLSPVPEAFAAAAQAAGAGALSCTCCLGIPVKGEDRIENLSIPGGVLSAATPNTIEWPAASSKFWIPAPAAKSIKAVVMEKGSFYVELVRIFTPPSDQLYDAAFEAYHAHTLISFSEQLMEPGAMEAAVAVAGWQAATAAVRDGRLAAPLLPAPEPPTPAKAKSIEPMPEEPAGGPAPCAWATAQSSLRIVLRLPTPVVPPWKPPPKPTKGLYEVLPMRSCPRIPWSKPELTPSEAFQEMCKEVAGMIVQQHEGMYGFGNRSATNAEYLQRKKDIEFALNESGAYLDLKERLRPSVTRVAREVMGEAELSEEQRQAALAELHMRLVEDMHGAVRDVTTPRLPPPKAPDRERREQLPGLAGEAELRGDAAAAAAYHQERILVEPGWKAWHDYATFCLRSGNPSKAEACLREALAADDSQLEPLLTLACVLWHTGLFTDRHYLQDADVLLHRAKDVEGGRGEVWALMAMVYSAMGSRRAADARNCAFEARRLAKQQLPELGPRRANGYLQAALRLLDVHLGECAGIALDQAGSVKEGQEELRCDVALCRARCFSLMGEHAAALEAVNEAAQLAGEADPAPDVLRGDIQLAAGQSQLAFKAWQAALQKAPEAVPLAVYLRLGAGFLEQRQWEYAHDVYLQACAARPCCSSWLGMGIALVRLNRLDDAAVALSEACTLDATSPAVWAWLGLLALAQGREEEADFNMGQAYRCRLADAELLREIGQKYLDLGRYKRAETALRRSLRSSPSPHTHCLLADALFEQEDLTAAASHFHAVVNAADHKDRDERLHAMGQLAVLYSHLGEEEKANEMAVMLVQH